MARALMSQLHSLLAHRSTRLFVASLLILAIVPGAHAQQASFPIELKGSGKDLTIRTDSQEKDKDTWHLRGHVEILYEGMRLTSDEASYDEASGEILARGHVVFDDPKSHLVAEEVHYNVQTQKGWFVSGTGFFRPKMPPRRRVLKTESPFYISGESVDRLDEDTYILHHGRMTTCECEKKGWSVWAREARVTLDDKAVSRDAVFRFLGVPLFYAPFLVDSLAREPRQTGFLIPNLGNSSQKGYIIGDGFFWAINPSADLMFGVEDYSKRGLAERGEFRARPSQNANFTVNYFGVNDKDSDLSLRAPGESIQAMGKDDNIGEGFRAVVSFDYVNTMAFRLTWSPSLSEAVSSEADQSGFLSKSFDAYSFNVSAERYEDFLSAQEVPGNAVIVRHLPGIEFTGEDRQILNWPVYFSFETSADAVGRTAPGLTAPLLTERLDFHPQLMFRAKELWHFRFLPTVGLRTTYYGTSLESNRGPLDRLLFHLGFDLRPPSLEKVFTPTFRGYRFKHVIEPDIQYHLVRAHDPEDIPDIMLFDQLDIFTETNEVEYSLTNTILARKDAPEGTPDPPQARDLFSWRVSEKYYFDPTFGGALVAGRNNVFASTIDLTGFAFEHGQRLSPVTSVFKFAPFSNYDTEMRADLSPTGAGGVLDAGVSSRVRKGLFGLSLSDFFINRSSYFSSLLGSSSSASQATTTGATAFAPSTAFHLMSAVATYGDPNRKGLSGALGFDYNFQQKIFEHQISQVSYNFGCFAINVEYQYYNLGPLRHESQFRIALALANVGTFGNLRPRERLSLDTTPP